VRIEHIHRLYGAAVGLATIVLAGWFLAFERRRWLKGLGVLALAAVIGQGVLGGLRVTRVSTLLAAVHGCTGQAFFGLLVALCVFTGRDWTAATGRETDRGHWRGRCLLALALVYAQIVAGGWLRHFATPEALWVHAVIALTVLVYAFWLGRAIHVRRAEVPWLLWPSRLLAGAVGFQVVLGIAALALLWPLDGTARPVPLFQAIVRTGHQTNAAILFAAGIVQTLRSFRHLAGAADTAASRPADRPVGRPEPAALDWEAVA
jgi:heme a synthase